MRHFIFLAGVIAGLTLAAPGFAAGPCDGGIGCRTPGIAGSSSMQGGLYDCFVGVDGHTTCFHAYETPAEMADGHDSYRDYSDGFPDSHGSNDDQPTAGNGGGTEDYSAPVIGGGVPRDEPVAAAGADWWEYEATRLFAGPDMIPPQDFAAYAILATRHSPRGSDRSRYEVICAAYLEVLEASDAPSVPSTDKQLVTVWPVAEPGLEMIGLADTPAERCAAAIDHYHLPSGRQAIKEAERGSPALLQELSVLDGPFLLAWNPSTDKGNPGVPLFRMDLSQVRTESQARAFFRLWRKGILENTDHWVDGWQDVGTRLRLKVYIENYSDQALSGLGQAGKLVTVFYPGGN
ncbi:hypothetical protein [Marinovum sp.]|uniref:hypothetical protein n=1 Tax=Marinovum sp. TaxID=2024839 RepID=UPI003A91AA8E